MISFAHADSIESPSPEQLDTLEHGEGVKLPPCYRNFLLNGGGGEPTPNRIRFAGRSDIVAFISGFKSNKPYLNLLGARDFWGEPRTTGYLMIGANHSGDSWLLKFTEPEYGAVFLWDHEAENIEPTTYNHLTRAFDSFEEFLSSIA